MRVAINLLTDDPHHPSGAHWFWTRVIPEIAELLTPGEELHLLVSPRSAPTHQGYGPGVHYITFPWSNEHPRLRVLSEQVYAPLRLPRTRIDVFSTLIAPAMKPAPGMVAHFKTMHAFTQPRALRPEVRWFRRRQYPRTAAMADAIIINSESLRSEVERYLDVPPGKLRMIPEAVDHDLFSLGDQDESRARVSSRFGVTRPFVLFVSSLWPYKNCDGLLRAFALAKPDLDGYQLAIVGPDRDRAYVAQLHGLAESLGISDDVVWVGGVPLEDTADFYRAAEVFVYPSWDETFGLPLLEAMACGCAVVTSDRTAMPETAGGAALLADPGAPETIASAIREACGGGAGWLRDLGLKRAAEFSWARTGQMTLNVYREVYAMRGGSL